MKLTKKEDGKYYDEKGQVVDLTIEEPKPVVDKDKIFNEVLRDRFKLEASQLTELDKIAEQARTQEKKKLYDEIEANKKKAKDEESARLKLEGELEALKKDIEKGVKKGGEKDPQEIADLKLELQRKEEALNKLKADAESTFNALKNDMATMLDKERLERYRDSKIASAGGKIVLSLVRGSTKEEIDIAVETAKQEYKRIEDETVARIAADKKAEEDKQKQISSTKINTPNNIPLTVQDAEYNSDKIKSMSMEEYAEFRKKIGLEKTGM